MRAVIQRATSGEVRVDGTVVGRLALDVPAEAGERRQGLVVLLGVQRGDGAEQVATVARKIAELRILDDERSALDAGAPVCSSSVRAGPTSGTTSWPAPPGNTLRCTARISLSSLPTRASTDACACAAAGTISAAAAAPHHQLRI